MINQISPNNVTKSLSAGVFSRITNSLSIQFTTLISISDQQNQLPYQTQQISDPNLLRQTIYSHKHLSRSFTKTNIQAHYSFYLNFKNNIITLSIKFFLKIQYHSFQSYGPVTNSQSNTHQTSTTRVTHQILTSHSQYNLWQTYFYNPQSQIHQKQIGELLQIQIRNHEQKILKSTYQITEAFIRVNCISSSDNTMQQLAQQQIYLKDLNQNKSFVLSNNKIRLEYQAVALIEYQQKKYSDSGQDQKSEINLQTETLNQGNKFEPINLKRSATDSISNRQQTIQKNSSLVIDTTSQINNKKKQKSNQDHFPNFDQNSNGDSYNNKSDFNFMQPITHTPPRSPKSSRKKLKQFSDEQFNEIFVEKKKPQKESSHHQKQKSQHKNDNNPILGPHTQISSKNIQFSDLVFYAVVAIISFFLGIMFKQR